MKAQGFPVKQYNQPVKRYCQILRLKDHPELIERYRQLHSQEHSWKEIRDGIRQVGILEMEIYILDNTVIMIVETPLDFNWKEAMEQLATLPRQQEWEELVAESQNCSANASSAEKWQLMERIFYLYD